MHLAKTTVPLLLGILAGWVFPAQPAVLHQEPNTWVKRSPLKNGPVSPAMGYEASLAYDPLARRVIRWGGHNQGGGGEQNAETWLFDPATSRWTLQQPNCAPPGVCCAQQNVFDMAQNRFLRFAAFSGNHGWQWFREIYLNNSSVWSYDLASNTWRDLRPVPTPRTGPLRCAAWDSEHQVAVIFGGEGIHEGTLVYDPYTNTWTRMHPKRQPDDRSGGNLVYDAAHKQHILFGSQFGNDPRTWAYNLRSNTWRNLKPATSPPTDCNDAVLTYDAANKVVVAVVRVADQLRGNEVKRGHLETWVYDSGRNAWKRMKPKREPDGWRNRRRILVAIPDQNLSLLENYVTPADQVAGIDREQQIWTYRYQQARPEAAPSAPTEVKLTTTAQQAMLTWKPSASPGVTGYLIYRGQGNISWLTDFRQRARVNKGLKSYRDSEVQSGTVYSYFIRSITKNGQESAPSLKVRTQPRVVENVVVSVVSARKAVLSWVPPGRAIAGYHVERAIVEMFSEDEIGRLKKDTQPLADPSVGAVGAIGPFTRLTRKPIPQTTFTDSSIDLTRPRVIEGKPLYVHGLQPDQRDSKGKPYRYAVHAYRIRAVNALGVESGPSPSCRPWWPVAVARSWSCSTASSAGRRQRRWG
jgi:hypothetical protein